MSLQRLFTQDRIAEEAFQRWNLDFSLKDGQDLDRQKQIRRAFHSSNTHLNIYCVHSPGLRDYSSASEIVLLPAPAGCPTWKLLADQASKETASQPVREARASGGGGTGLERESLPRPGSRL